MIKNKRTKTILGTGLILVLITVAIVVFFVRKSSESNKDIDPVETINYTEATDQEKEETAQNKEKVIANTEAQNSQNQTQTNNNQQAEKKSVKPVIGYIGQNSPGSEVQANGYVPGVIEKDGMCTLTLTKNDSSVKDSRVSIDNVQDTSCGLMIIPKSKLSNGTWTATLSYNSTKSSGTSEKVTVEVK